MKFKDVYTKSKGLWPTEIDISDGIFSDAGWYSNNLSRTRDSVESKAKSISEWIDLTTWIIFRNLHEIARENHRRGIRKVTLNEISEEKVKSDLLTNLQISGYEDMLEQFKKNNY